MVYWGCEALLVIVCRSFRDLQPTTIDRSQPNLVGRYIPVLGPCKSFWIPISHTLGARGKICKISPISNNSPLTRILATANVTHHAIWLIFQCILCYSMIRSKGESFRLFFVKFIFWDEVYMISLFKIVVRAVVMSDFWQEVEMQLLLIYNNVVNYLQVA